MTTKITNGKIDVTSNYLNNQQRRELLDEALLAAELVGVPMRKVKSVRLSVRRDVAFGKPWAALIDAKGDGHYQINLRLERYYNEIHRAQLLLHEMTHLKQYATGEIKVDKHGNEYWQGKKIEETLDYLVESLSDEEYENLPWEREPYQNERDLLENFFMERTMREINND